MYDIYKLARFQPCVSQRAGGEVDVCCRDPNYKSVDLVSLHHSLLQPNCIFCTSVLREAVKNYLADFFR